MLAEDKVKPGDLYSIGSQGAKGNYRPYPVLVIKVSPRWKMCHCLVNRKVRMYMWNDLGSFDESR